MSVCARFEQGKAVILKILSPGLAPAVICMLRTHLASIAAGSSSALALDAAFLAYVACCAGKLPPLHPHPHPRAHFPPPFQATHQPLNSASCPPPPLASSPPAAACPLAPTAQSPGSARQHLQRVGQLSASCMARATCGWRWARVQRCARRAVARWQGWLAPWLTVHLEQRCSTPP